MQDKRYLIFREKSGGKLRAPVEICFHENQAEERCHKLDELNSYQWNHFWMEVPYNVGE